VGGSPLFEGASPQSGFPALESLPWSSDLSVAVAEARRILVAQDNLFEQLSGWLRWRSADDVAWILDRSHERSTHFKWCLGGFRRSYYVWLHQYRDAISFGRSREWAATVHNHRYGFASAVLSGALHTTWFEDQAESQRLVGTRTDRIQAGEIYTVLPDDIHQIVAVEDQTYTLVLQSCAHRNSSTVFDPLGGTRREVRDFDQAFLGVMRTLGPQPAERPYR